MLFLFVGLLVGSLGEYWVHRLMHCDVIRVDIHVGHHKENNTRGWLMEFLDYIMSATVPIVVVGGGLQYWIGAQIFWWWLLGVFCHMAFSAYTHEMYHTDPNLVFWIKRPIHYFHHHHNQWRHNFAFTTTVWDRLFGTYKDDPEWKPTPISLWRVFSIRWI